MPLTAAEIDRAFPGRIPPIAVRHGYRLLLGAVLGVLILLQLTYVLLVVAAASATAGYAMLLPAIVSTIRTNVITLPLILAPLAAGGIATFFLFKPLFARRTAPPEPLELTARDEPGPFSFVGKLCDCLGSPHPSRIFVNLDVNASASLYRGWRSLFTGELALTIGLPLVQGLSLRQFAGVLAHEFGHFSQSAGLRVHYLIASIQIWFLRVAHERDDWDVKLETWYEDAGWRGKIVWGLAKAVVWLSRRFLAILQKAANFVSAAFSRQMEFDADRYEALVAGVEAFEATTLEMPVLTVTANQAWSDLDRGYSSRRFAEDIPALMAARHRQAGGDLAGTVRHLTLEEATGRFATHPSPSDRIASVRKLGGGGRFGLDGPAVRLFEDFPALSRAASEHHYRNVLGFDLAEISLLPVDAVTEESARQAQREAARRDLFGNALLVTRWLRWPVSEPAEAPPGEFDDRTYWRLEEEVLLQNGAVALLDAGAKIKPEVFHVSKSDSGTARQEHARSMDRFAEEARVLRQFASSQLARLWRAARTPEAREDFDGFRALLAEQDALFEVRMALAAHDLLAANAAHLPKKSAPGSMLRHEEQAFGQKQEIAARLSRFAELLTPPDGLKGTAATHWFLDRADWLSEHLLERVCWLTLESERA